MRRELWLWSLVSEGAGCSPRGVQSTSWVLSGCSGGASCYGLSPNPGLASWLQAQDLSFISGLSWLVVGPTTCSSDTLEAAKSEQGTRAPRSAAPLFRLGWDIAAMTFTDHRSPIYPPQFPVIKTNKTGLNHSGRRTDLKVTNRAIITSL